MKIKNLRFKCVTLTEFWVLLPRYEDKIQCDRTVKFAKILHNTLHSDCRKRKEQILFRSFKKLLGSNVRNDSTLLPWLHGTSEMELKQDYVITCTVSWDEIVLHTANITVKKRKFVSKIENNSITNTESMFSELNYK
jgi:hypothetical protein